MPSAKVAVFAVDIQNFKDVDKAVEAAVAEFGSIDILVNNVSIILPQMNK
jgi:NAD(P)-dependent dehydrogenase (short-subunit alcohol dehydrogenase family)